VYMIVQGKTMVPDMLLIDAPSEMCLICFTISGLCLNPHGQSGKPNQSHPYHIWHPFGA
jgi:hypothetical protein